jgi:flagellar motor switch protein FliN/FliY
VKEELATMVTDDKNSTFDPINPGGKAGNMGGQPGGQAFEFSGISGAPGSKIPNDIEFILDIPLDITVEVGRTTMQINELLKLGQGSVIELSKIAGENLDILANQSLIARGEIVVVKENYGIRLTEIVSPMERIRRLK